MVNTASYLLFLSSVFVPLKTVKTGDPLQTLEKFYTADVNYIPRSGIPHQHGTMGISTVAKFTMLSNTPTLFHVRRPGLENDANTVSFESIQKPGYYLRYKNYKFHMQKEDSTILFAKDASFREKRGPRGRAYELTGRDNWFMCHSDLNPFTLQARSEKIGTRDFESNCVYVPVRQTLVQKKNIVKTVPSGGAMVIDKVPTTQTSDKCISVRFVNNLGGPVRVVSSMKPEGYLVTANAFKLKTIFKHANHKQRHVIFYAENVQDRDDDVLLNSQNVYTTKPNDCGETFTDVILTSQAETESQRGDQTKLKDTPTNQHNLQSPSITQPAPPVAAQQTPHPPAIPDTVPKIPSTADDIPQAVVSVPENSISEANAITVPGQIGVKPFSNELKNLDNILKKKQNHAPTGYVPGVSTPGLGNDIGREYSAWSSYGPCSTTCGVGVRRRTRICNPGMSCGEPLSETRACIKELCASECTHTSGGNVRPGTCCSFPFTYNDVQYDNCILSRSNNERLWCSTTHSFDQDKLWGLCPKSTKAPIRSLLKPIAPQLSRIQQQIPTTQRRQQQPRPVPLQPSSPYEYRPVNTIRSPYPSYYYNNGYNDPYKAYKDNNIPCNPMCSRTCVQQCPRHCCVSARSDVPVTAYLGNNYGPTDRRNTISRNWLSRNRRDLLPGDWIIEQYES